MGDVDKATGVQRCPFPSPGLLPGRPCPAGSDGLALTDPSSSPVPLSTPGPRSIPGATERLGPLAGDQITVASTLERAGQRRAETSGSTALGPRQLLSISSQVRSLPGAPHVYDQPVYGKFV